MSKRKANGSIVQIPKRLKPGYKRSLKKLGKLKPIDESLDLSIVYKERLQKEIVTVVHKVIAFIEAADIVREYLFMDWKQSVTPMHAYVRCDLNAVSSLGNVPELSHMFKLIKTHIMPLMPGHAGFNWSFLYGRKNVYSGPLPQCKESPGNDLQLLLSYIYYDQEAAPKCCSVLMTLLEIPDVSKLVDILISFFCIVMKLLTYNPLKVLRVWNAITYLLFWVQVQRLNSSLWIEYYKDIVWYMGRYLSSSGSERFGGRISFFGLPSNFVLDLLHGLLSERPGSRKLRKIVQKYWSHCLSSPSKVFGYIGQTKLAQKAAVQCVAEVSAALEKYSFLTFL